MHGDLFRFALLLAPALALVVPALAAPNPEAKVLVVGDGPGSDAVVDSVAKAKIARTTQVAKKAKEVPCKLPDVVAKGAAKTKVVDCLREQVDGAKADAIVVIHVVPGKTRVAEVRIVSSDPYVETFEAKVPLGAKPGPEDATAVLAVVEPKLTEIAPKAAPTATATSSPAATVASGTPSAAPTAPPPPPKPIAPSVAIEVGPFVGLRTFGYADPVGTALRDYDLKGAVGITAGVEAYPGATFPARSFQLGVGLRYQTSTGLGSETSSGRRISTMWTRFDAQVRGRILLGEAGSHLTVGLGVTRELFDFAERTTSLPIAKYFSARASLDLRLALGPIALLVGGAALPGLSAPTGVAERWAGARSLGFEGGLGVALPLGTSVEIRALATHTRYVSRYDGPPTDASGATDALSRLQVTLGFSY